MTIVALSPLCDYEILCVKLKCKYDGSSQQELSKIKAWELHKHSNTLSKMQ